MNDRPEVQNLSSGSIRPSRRDSRDLCEKQREREGGGRRDEGEGFLISNANCADRPSGPAVTATTRGRSN